MSHDPIQKQDLDTARQTLQERRDASARKLAEVAIKEAEWKIALRAAGDQDQEVTNKQAAFAQAVQDLKTAREEERTARDAVVKALAKWLDVDPAADVQTLSAEFPIVLFPVRLETRFHPVGNPQELWVRIYPDEIMADTHEPWLTQAERNAGEIYWNTAWNPAEDKHAWRTLLTQFPATRAAWLVDATKPTNEVARPTEAPTFPASFVTEIDQPPLTAAEIEAGLAYWKSAWNPTLEQKAWSLLAAQFPKRPEVIKRATTPSNLASQPAVAPDFPQTADIRPQSWTRPAEARLLPDRWIILAYRGGQEIHREVSAAIVEPLALTINPTAGADGTADISAEKLLQDLDVAWTFDFAQAEKVGMAVRITLQPADIVDGFDRLLAVGVKSSLTAKDGGKQLKCLLDAHHYTHGLAFVRQGTPTNNTSAEAAGFPPEDPGGTNSFAVEREGLPIDQVTDNDGHVFMNALGMPPALAAHVAGADRTEQQAARAMNNALWPATLGYYMEQMLASGRRPPWVPAKIADQKAIQAARHHFVEHVHGRGPYPAFRVGATPYGLLPVTSLDRWMEHDHEPDPAPGLVVVHIESRPGDRNKGYCRIGANLDAEGTIAGPWTIPEQIPDSFGTETAGAGIAIADINGDGRPDILVFHIESQAGTSMGYYRIGWNLDANGRVDGWSAPMRVPGNFGSKPEGAGVAIADIDNDGQLDLIVFHIEREFINSPIFTGFGRNTNGYYQIGWKLKGDGQIDPNDWGPPISLPRSGFAYDRPGAAITVADIDGDGALDLMVLQFVEPSQPPSGTSMGYYRIGWQLRSNGQVDHWGDSVIAQAAPAGENQGAGIALANIDTDSANRPDLIIFRVDKPLPGEKWNVHYQIGWNLDVTGNPTGWSEPKPVPGDFSASQGAGIALAVSGGWVSAPRTLRNLWKKSILDVPRVGRNKNDPDRDLLEILGMDASAREARIRTILGGDLLVNLYHYRGTGYFNTDWSSWSSNQQGILNDILRSLGYPAWDVRINRANWNPRIGEMVFDQNAYLFKHPFVTSDPLSEKNKTLPVVSDGGRTYENYLHWILRAPLSNLKTGLMGGELPLLYHLLRHAMLLEYASAAFEDYLKHGPNREKDRREPEIIGVVPGTETRPTVWDRLAMWVTNGSPVTEALKSYRSALEALIILPTAELDRLLTETLDVCSHRLDAWITSLASKRLREMREDQARAQTIGNYLGAFGWVENLRPAPASRYKRETLNGQTVLVQDGSGGRIHAPSMTHAAAAAILRNAHLTRAGAERKRYAVDLSSERVRAARWLLDAVREGQPLGAVLGYRFERGLHERQLEKYIDPLRKSFSLVTAKETAVPVEAISARNVVDGLALQRAKDPFDTLTDPSTNLPAPISNADKLALEAEVAALTDALDAVADLLTAESVYQIIRGNTAAGAASLDAMAQGLRAPDPEIARAPRGGTALTHRVAMILGEPAPALDPDWAAIAATPRAIAEPDLDAWVGSLLGNPANVTCRVSYLTESLKEVKLSDLRLRPLDVLALARGMQVAAQASELDQRVAYAALEQAPASSQILRITYEPHPDRDPNTVRTFPEILELAKAINAVIGGARMLRPEDLLPPEAAAKGKDAVWAADGALQRAKDALEALGTAKKKLDDEIHPLSGTPNPTELRKTMAKATLFGLGAMPASAKDPDPSTGTPEEQLKARQLIADRLKSLLEEANSVKAELDRRFELASAIDLDGATDDASKIQTATQFVQTVFGRDFVFLAGFKPVEATPGELKQALDTGPKFVDEETAADRPNTIRKWWQGAARVRPPLERWRRLWLYAGALGARQADLDVAQLPYKDGEQWVALPFKAEEQRPPSGRVSLALYRAVQPAADATWKGLLLDEWTEVIPNQTELTGITFHYDDPGAEAAQAVLLAVPPKKQGNWDLETLIAILHETLDLAKIRAVDGELLGALGQVLPAIVLAENTAKDTVSTNFGPLRRQDGIEIV